MGRRKIEIRKLENTRNRNATFKKRRQGILKKAHELAILTDSKVTLSISNKDFNEDHVFNDKLPDSLVATKTTASSPSSPLTLLCPSPRSPPCSLAIDAGALAVATAREEAQMPHLDDEGDVVFQASPDQEVTAWPSVEMETIFSQNLDPLFAFIPETALMRPAAAQLGRLDADWNSYSAALGVFPDDFTRLIDYPFFASEVHDFPLCQMYFEDSMLPLSSKPFSATENLLA